MRRLRHCIRGKKCAVWLYARSWPHFLQHLSETFDLNSAIMLNYGPTYGTWQPGLNAEKEIQFLYKAFVTCHHRRSDFEQVIQQLWDSRGRRTAVQRSQIKLSPLCRAYETNSLYWNILEDVKGARNRFKKYMFFPQKNINSDREDLLRCNYSKTLCHIKFKSVCPAYGSICTTLCGSGPT